jgi:y4mF family transcriptional regulator
MKKFPNDHISSFLKYKRSRLGLNQEELAKKAGVGIRFLRELEQGKESLKMDKVNQVLRFFGYCTSPVSEKMSNPYSILLNGMQKKIKIYLRKNRMISGILVGFQTKNGQVLRWKIVAGEHLKEYKRTNHPGLVQIAEHVDVEKWEPEHDDSGQWEPESSEPL